jgi:ATP phosphoribosyltransferase regulatory subunit
MTRFREKMRPMLPKGVATLLPDAAALKRYVEESILAVFMQWGYQEVITPLFEYLDVIAEGLGEGLVEKGYKFVDRSTGRVMLLRPDVTPQIARMVAMLMADAQKPLRLCYRANVFRHEEEHAGRAREVFQIGGELIGPEGPEADAEAIAVAIESLRRLGLEDFKVALGHSDFFRGLMNSINLPLEVQRRIKTAVAKKETSRLKQVLKTEAIPDRQVRTLMAMSELLGGEEVIRQAERLTKLPVCKQAVARLRAVYGILKASGWKDYLLVDLSEIRGFDYYTGMVFEVFVKNLGFSVGRGGRYDQLVGKFGKACPSTGFAFDIEHVQWACQQDWPASRSIQAHPSFSAADLLLVDTKQSVHRLFRVATTLRNKGYRVIQQSGRVNLEEILRYAKNNGIGSVALVSDEEKVLYVDSENGKKQTFSLKALLTRLSSPSRRRSAKR